MYQLIITTNLTSCLWTEPNRKPGDVVWVRSMEAARHLLENGFARWPNNAEGPREIKPMEPTERKDGGVTTTSAKVLLHRAPGWPVDRFAVIDPEAWRGEVVVCVGGGPSVVPSEIAALEGRCRVIVVNNAYQLAPFADIAYFADHRWWQDFGHRDHPAFKAFQGQKCTIENTGMLVNDASIFMLHNYGTEGLSEKQNGVNTGCNGGFQAMNIAALARPKRIALIGYDMRYVGGRSHWHKGHPPSGTVPEAHYSSMYARSFATALPALQRLGVEVINCSMGSTVKCFPFLPLSEAVA